MAQGGAGGAGATRIAPRPDGLTPDACLDLLLEGNARWAAGAPRHPHREPERRAALVGGQQPYAHVITCIDSRVVPELLFDCGLGDVLVTRMPGNPVFDAVVASARFAVRHLGVGVVYVLGHEACGAVTAALRAADEAHDAPSDVRALAALLAPALAGAPDEHSPGRIDTVVRRNVALGLATLRADALLAAAIAAGRIRVEGGCYELASGRVTTL